MSMASAKASELIERVSPSYLVDEAAMLFNNLGGVYHPKNAESLTQVTTHSTN